MRKIFIDCFNISTGGGLVHIQKILMECTTPVVVAGSSKIISSIKNINNINLKHIEFYNDDFLNSNLFVRFFWHLFLSKSIYKKKDCVIAFYPGGINFSGIRNFVTMSRNLLPFNFYEIFRYKSPVFIFKLILIRFLQINSFNRSTGLIFLNKYAYQYLSSYIKKDVDITFISHGNDSFHSASDISSSISSKLSHTKFLYVSHFSPYKNHLTLLKSFKRLLKKYPFITLTLVGSFDECYEACYKFADESSILNSVNFIDYVSHDELHDLYTDSDVFLFSSSCENYPNIINELLIYNKPIISSYFSPMPALLLNNSLYFNPTDENDIFITIDFYLTNGLTNISVDKFISENNVNCIDKLDWKSCSILTFDYIKNKSGASNES